MLTDPPYHDDVQYADLSGLFRAWTGHTDGVYGEVVPVKGEPDSFERGLSEIFSEMARVLRPDGHLVFSFANRNPDAWIQLISALQDAGFCSSGFAVLHAENETDHLKRGRNSCVLDLVIDLVLSSGPMPSVRIPKLKAATAEHDFLCLMASYIRDLGSLSDSWEEKIRQEVAAHPFISGGVA